jgi:hypothetical protein
MTAASWIKWPGDDECQLKDTVGLGRAFISKSEFNGKVLAMEGIRRTRRHDGFAAFWIADMMADRGRRVLEF